MVIVQFCRMPAYIYYYNPITVKSREGKQSTYDRHGTFIVHLVHTYVLMEYHIQCSLLFSATIKVLYIHTCSEASLNTQEI